MLVTVLDVLKKRNNAVSVLASGICSALSELGIDHVTARYAREFPDGRRLIDPSVLDEGTDVLLVPYWITGLIWDLNLAEVRARLPRARIICYTGTSPYWNGSIPCYVEHTRSLDCSGLTDVQRANFDAVDLHAVARSRPGVSPPLLREVGMGLSPEIRVGRKSAHPVVVLDAMKPGWDEEPYARAVDLVEEMLRAIPSARVVALGTNKHSPRLMATGRVVFMPGEFIPFEQVASVWASSWAFVCHNESFGYPVVENSASGTMVFSSPGAEVPPWHRDVVAPMDLMTSFVAEVAAKNQDDRQREAEDRAAKYLAEVPDFSSWTSTVSRILA